LPSLLEHALLVVDDDLGRAEVEQPLEAVVPVDDAPVEVVQVTRSEAAAVELHHRAELRRDYRDRLQDHPLGLVLRGDEGVDDLEPLDGPALLLPLGRLDRLAERLRLGVEIEVAQEVPDRLGSHAALEVDAEAVRGAEPVLELPEQHLVVDDQLRLEILEELPRLGEAGAGVLGRVAGVAAPRLDVEVHLADLQRPLDDRVEVLLLHPPVGLEAEVVRDLPDLVRGLGRDLLQHLEQEPVAEPPHLLERLRIDVLDELRVLALELRALEQGVADLVDVLRDRALLGAGRLVGLLGERREGVANLRGDGRDLVDLAAREPAIVADR
jgi:hypothetical protein